jgi:hypothetical protein
VNVVAGFKSHSQRLTGNIQIVIVWIFVGADIYR